MNSKKPELKSLQSHSLPLVIFLITRELHIALDRRMARYGLTHRQAKLLIRCVHNSGASLNQLMPHLGTDNAGVSRLVDRLEAANLVERTPGPDRRSLALKATEAGVALAPKLEEVFRLINQNLIEGLSREDIDVADELLHRILTNVRILNDNDKSPDKGFPCRME